MKFSDKIKQPLFWFNFLKVALPFFFFVTLISLLVNSWSLITAFDFAGVAQQNFANGKWVSFWSMKFLISIFYGLYITNKNMK
ncbi:MAG: hypothetical protein ABF286_03170 [Polaribacter sp.]|jgi:hypothetical protein